MVNNIKRTKVLAASLAVVMAMLGLLGYIPGLRLLGSVQKDYIPMAPSTAACFMLQGVILLRLAYQRRREPERAIMRALAGVTALFGLAEVLGHFTGLDLSFEDMLMPTMGQLGEIPIGRMSPLTGALFFLTGTSVFILFPRSRSPENRPMHGAGILGGLVTILSFTAILSYLMGTPLLYEQGAMVPMALTTAFAFFSVGTAIIAAAGKNSLPLRILKDHSTRARLLRAFLPLVVGAVLIEGLASRHIPVFFPVNPAIIASITIVVVMVLTGLMAIWVSASLGLVIEQIEKKRQKAEEEVRENEIRLSQMVQSCPIPIFVINNNRVITHWNTACENLTGISSDKMIGTQNQWVAFYSEERPVLADFLVDNEKDNEIAKYYERKHEKFGVAENGYKTEGFFPALGEKGKWLFITAATLRDTEGKVTGAIETLQDVSERREIQEVLQKNMQNLNERVRELNCLYSISKMVENQNILLEEIFQGTVDLIPPTWRYPEITCARIILEGQEFKTSNFEETIWKQVGEIIVYSVLKGTLEVCYLEERAENEEGPFTKEDRALLNAICERLGRITEHRWTLNALDNSEKRFRDLIEYSPIGISIIQDDQIVYQNPEQERFLGPLPRPPELTDYKNIHPDDVVKMKEFYQNLTSSEIQSQETEFRFYPVDESGNRVDMKWTHCRTGLIEYQGRKAMLVNMMDITRTKELENILKVQDKMSSLGRVAAGIAHEIRNPLSGINVYLNTMEKMYDRGDRPEQLKQIFKQLQSASNKIESVIRRVMDFSKPSEPNFASTDINGPIEEAINLSSVTFRKRGINFEKALAGDMPWCRVDSQLIEQVILNLFTNAAEAMKNVEGEKRIEVTSSMENDCITVRVCDSGPGVPIHVKEKVFDPFYTTKNGSTGIGLSLSHRIISDHGGSLNVYQSKWGGAEFRIVIPLAKGTTSR